MKWTFNKGKHYPKQRHFALHRGVSLCYWEVKFNKTNLYDPGFEDDWNKLCGWSYGILPSIEDNIYGKGFRFTPAHHENSIRVGWRPIHSLHLIELSIYTYENGERKVSEKTIKEKIGRTIRITLHYSKGIIRLKTQTIDEAHQQEVSMPYSAKYAIGYMLNPYVGGNEPAVHDMHLNLTRLQ